MIITNYGIIIKYDELQIMMNYSKITGNIIKYDELQIIMMNYSKTTIYVYIIFLFNFSVALIVMANCKWLVISSGRAEDRGYNR